jgi:hypothetical protein
MGLFYYYSGNTALGSHYHRLAEHGLTPKEHEIYKLELNLPRYLALREGELFGVRRGSQPESQPVAAQQESQQIEEEEIERQQGEQRLMVSKMLKDGELRKVGQRLQKHMLHTSSLASIVPHSHSPSPPEKGPEGLPLINVSHVLKSHLSRNRMGRPSGRDWELFRLMEMIAALPG